MLQGKRFDSNEEVISEGVFWGQRQIVLLKKHQIVREAMESAYYPKRDYVDEQSWILPKSCCLISYAQDLLSDVLENITQDLL